MIDQSAEDLFPVHDEPEEHRPSWRVCQYGFGLIALALLLLCLHHVSFLALMFGEGRAVRRMWAHTLWLWGVSAPITWGSLIGSYLLWGRFRESKWQRRAGLLVAMNAFDGCAWILDRGPRLGLVLPPFEHEWALHVTTMGLGWFELMLATLLAAEVLGRIDHHVPTHRPAANMTVLSIGCILWAIYTLTSTAWGTWPLIPRPPAMDGLLLLLFMTLVGTVGTFQTTVLCLMASRACRRHARELERREWDHDLLRSRSETEGDDIRWQ